MQKDRTYVCIDLKSFYASVEMPGKRIRSHDYESCSSRSRKVR